MSFLRRISGSAMKSLACMAHVVLSPVLPRLICPEVSVMLPAAKFRVPVRSDVGCRLPVVVNNVGCRLPVVVKLLFLRPRVPGESRIEPELSASVPRMFDAA